MKLFGVRLYEEDNDLYDETLSGTGLTGNNMSEKEAEGFMIEHGATNENLSEFSKYGVTQYNSKDGDIIYFDRR